MSDIHQQISEDFFKKYIGRDYKEIDCWELVRLFYLEVMNRELPSYYTSRPVGILATRQITYTALNNYEKVDNPQFGDIILIKLYGYPIHVGLYLNDISFLHTCKNLGVVVDRMETWNKRIEGFYRPKYD